MNVLMGVKWKISETLKVRVYMYILIFIIFMCMYVYKEPKKTISSICLSCP